MAYGRQKELTQALTVKTSGAYTANDVLHGLITFNVANVAGSGLIRWLRVTDDDNEKAELAIYFFNAAPQTFTDDAAFNAGIQDLKKCIGKVLVQAADYETINSNAVAILGHGVSTDNLNLDFTSADGSIYAYVVCTGTPTYTAAGDLSLTIGTWLDG